MNDPNSQLKLTNKINFESTGEGEGNVVQVITVGKFNKQAEILKQVYINVVEKGGLSLEEFAAFSAQVRTSSLSSEGMTPQLQICQKHEKKHGLIQTCIGQTDTFYSFEALKDLLAGLAKALIITADEATEIESKAKLEMPEMPEKEDGKSHVHVMLNQLNDLIDQLIGVEPLDENPDSQRFGDDLRKGMDEGYEF